jgi:hypothetical protein
MSRYYTHQNPPDGPGDDVAAVRRRYFFLLGVGPTARTPEQEREFRALAARLGAAC